MSDHISTEEAERIADDLRASARKDAELRWNPSDEKLKRQSAAAIRALAAERDAMREALRENGRLGCNTCLEVLDTLGENQP